MLTVTYGQRFRALRMANGLTPTAVAARLRIDPSNISTLEQSTRVPRLDTVLRHAQALRSKPSELLKEVETIYDAIRAGDFDTVEAPREPPRRRRRKPEEPGRQLAASD